MTQQQGAKIQRCIVVLGAICEHITVCKDIIKQLEYQSNDYWYVFIYYQFIYFQKKFESFEKLTFKKNSVVTATASGSNEENELIAEMPITSIKSLRPSSFHGACYAAARFALSLPDSQVQTRAVQALCGVFLGCPSYEVWVKTFSFPFLTFSGLCGETLLI